MILHEDGFVVLREPSGTARAATVAMVLFVVAFVADLWLFRVVSAEWTGEMRLIARSLMSFVALLICLLVPVGTAGRVVVGPREITLSLAGVVLRRIPIADVVRVDISDRQSFGARIPEFAGTHLVAVRLRHGRPLRFVARTRPSERAQAEENALLQKTGLMRLWNRHPPRR